MMAFPAGICVSRASSYTALLLSEKTWKFLCEDVCVCLHNQLDLEKMKAQRVWFTQTAAYEMNYFIEIRDSIRAVFQSSNTHAHTTHQNMKRNPTFWVIWPWNASEKRWKCLWVRETWRCVRVRTFFCNKWWHKCV